MISRFLGWCPRVRSWPGYGSERGEWLGPMAIGETLGDSTGERQYLGESIFFTGTMQAILFTS
jgi:hypothetical protein